MAVYTYIKQDIDGYYVSFSDKLDSILYNNIGTTYNDFLNNLWVLLSNSQVIFHNEHPEASVKEVWDTQLTPTPERTIEDAKAEMIQLIDEYDSSSNVNGFTVNETVEGWFTPEERSNYNSSISAAKLLGVDNLSFFVGDMLITVPTLTAEQMLAQVQLYADQCYIVTKTHKANVEALTTIEEVDEYPYTSGYPQKLNFTVENTEEVEE